MGDSTVSDSASAGVMTPTSRSPKAVGPRGAWWRRAWAPTVLGLMVVSWTALFGAFAIARHRAFLTHAFDMGQMIQATYAIRHGQSFSTITGLSVLGDHARFILYPIAYLGLSPAGLVIGQAFVLALGAVPVYLLVRRAAPAWAALLTAFTYLAYPSLQWTALFDVHPEVIATTALLFAFWAVESRRYLAYWPLLVLALSCREDVGVAVALLGVVLLAERRWRVGAWTVGVGALGFAVSTLVQRHVNPFGLSVFDQRFGYLFTSPHEAIATLGAIHTPQFAALMALGFLLPVPAMFFARWQRLVAAFPFLLMNLLSTVATQRTIYFHYGFLPTVFIFIAVADGMVRIATMRRPWPRWGVLAAVLAVTVVVYPFNSPFFSIGYHGTAAFPKPATIRRQIAETFPEQFKSDAAEVLPLIGPGTLSASANLVPQLAERPVIYMLPNPFFPAWFGEYLTKDAGPDVHPQMPADPPEWVVVDKLHGGPEPVAKRAELIALLPTRYTLVRETPTIQLWRLQP